MTVANTLEAASATYKSQVDLLASEPELHARVGGTETDDWPDPRPLGLSFLRRGETFSVAIRQIQNAPPSPLAPKVPAAASSEFFRLLLSSGNTASTRLF